MTAVEFIEEGIKAREKHWHDQYQQGYQRALSDMMLYIEEAKEMEQQQSDKDYQRGYSDGWNEGYDKGMSDYNKF